MAQPDKPTPDSRLKAVFWRQVAGWSELGERNGLSHSMIIVLLCVVIVLLVVHIALLRLTWEDVRANSVVIRQNGALLESTAPGDFRVVVKAMLGEIKEDLIELSARQCQPTPSKDKP